VLKDDGDGVEAEVEESLIMALTASVGHDDDISSAMCIRN
jgi:hypothetical protein